MPARAVPAPLPAVPARSVAAASVTKRKSLVESHATPHPTPPQFRAATLPLGLSTVTAGVVLALPAAKYTRALVAKLACTGKLGLLVRKPTRPWTASTYTVLLLGSNTTSPVDLIFIRTVLCR